MTVSSIKIIDEQSALDELCRQLPGETSIAVDTEFVRERTYFPKLCLIQVGTLQTITCIDCVRDLNLSPLLGALSREGLAWIAHSARQDLEIFWHAGRALPDVLIDTQIAAALLGYPPQIGLQDLLRATLDVTLDKTHARTDWSRRPLPEKALQYAADDVRFLPRLWDHLRSELDKLDRLSWFEEDSHRALHTKLMPDTITIYRRLKGAGSLQGRQVAVALALVRWRENRAQNADRPRRWILGDAAIVEIARAEPASLDELKSVRGLSRRTAARSGKSILHAIESAGDEDIRALAARVADADNPDASALRDLQQICTRRAEELGIHAEYLAAKRDLAAAVLGKPPPHLSSGWRAEQLRLSRHRG
jgi:ribonuclease D